MARETPGQAASTTVLADIEATVDGLCACGCGTRLDPHSDSAWFASHDCQARWSQRDLDRDSARIASPYPLGSDATLLTDEAPLAPRVMWLPEVADHAHPTAAELEACSDLTDYVVPGSLTFHEPDNSGCIFPPAGRQSANPLLLQRVDLRRENVVPVPGAPGTYRLIFNAVPLADIAVPPRPAPQPWWRRALNRLTRKA